MPSGGAGEYTFNYTVSCDGPIAYTSVTASSTVSSIEPINLKFAGLSGTGTITISGITVTPAAQ